MTTVIVAAVTFVVGFCVGVAAVWSWLAASKSEDVW